ncbi:hypothetical protein ABET52_19410 [Saccharococcus caldoxylosilyticus]|uniref:hypothetical protein n=1 Tax=Saccharococcus caldoxylosilyticus TaxID=81408 RepID=UPI003D3568EF
MWKKSMMALLLGFAFIVASTTNAYAASVNVWLDPGDYADGSSKLWVPTNGKYRWGVTVNSGSLYSVRYYLKKDGVTIKSGIISSGGSIGPLIYSANPGGYYSLHLDCNPNDSDFGCQAYGFIQNY